MSTYQARFNDDDVDYDLILALLGYIMTVSTSEDAILIFLPGWYDICKLGNELEGGGEEGGDFRLNIPTVTLHYQSNCSS